MTALEALEPRRLLAAEFLQVPSEDPGGTEVAPPFGSRSSHTPDHGWGAPAAVVPDHPIAAAFGSGPAGGSGGVPTAWPDSGGGAGSGSGNGAAPNLRVLDAYLVDGTGSRIDRPVVGELVAIQVQFETVDLPASVGYRIEYVVNGVALGSGELTLGGGQAAGIWYGFRSGWYAAPGEHEVQVTLDPVNALSEIDETDNQASFSFQPVQADFPQPLVWPVEGVPYADNAFTNYVDVNPTSGISDFRGGRYSYDGHNAWDIGPGLFAAQDAGIEIYAAADGVVVEAQDGYFDRHEAWIDPSPEANYVIIDHGGGWTTVYWHLRRDSVRVQVGDQVTAGETIGLMGSSGRSDGTHLHFGLRRQGFIVEPMYDQGTYLAQPLPYVGDAKYLMHGGVTNTNPTPHINERPSDVVEFAQRPGQLVYAWGYFSGLQPGDDLQFRWRRPNGSIYVANQSTIQIDYAQSWWWWSRDLPTQPDLGRWTVEYVVNGELLGESGFSVTAEGAAELRVEDLQGEIVLNDRQTPYDFGVVSQASTPPQRSFRVVNHGEQPLQLGPLHVPAGFSLVEGLPSSLAGGESDVFTLQFDTDTVGYHAGVVRVGSNDGDENPSRFAVEGLVVGSPLTPSLLLGISRRRAAEGTQLYGHIRRVGSGIDFAAPLTVTLSSSDPSEASVPPSVVIAAGEDSAVFPVTLPLDNLDDGTQLVQLTASSTAANPATTGIEVDNVSLPRDFGDAPSPYPTTEEDGGAHHLAIGPLLGESRDAEPDGSPSVVAGGDDLTGPVDDEDGVTFPSLQVGAQDVTLLVSLSGAPQGAKLDGWIDFHGDGSWDQPDDQVFVSRDLVAGENLLNIDVPLDAVPGETFARFRVSTVGGLGVGGFAGDGEVEDYRVSIIPRPPRVAEVTVNGGNAQRSRLQQLAVAFDSLVELEDSVTDPFRVTHRGTGQPVVAERTTAVDQGRTIVTLTFPGPPVPDGSYELTVDAALVSSGGSLLDGNADGSGGDDFRFGGVAVDRFYRLYGDADGNGSVNVFDFAAFRSTFGKSIGNDDFAAELDADGNGSINVFDFTDFRGNFGKSVSF